MERVIPIKKRQHDTLAKLFEQKALVESEIKARIDTLVEGVDGDLPDIATIRGVREGETGCELVLDVPAPETPHAPG